MRLIDKDEILKRKDEVYDKNGHLLLAVPTCEIWAAKTVDAVPLDKLCEWLAKNACYDQLDCGMRSRFSLLAEQWKFALVELMEGQQNCGAKMDGGETDDHG